MDGRGKGAAMQIETLVKDIYNVLEEEHTVSQENIDLFVKGITDVIVRSVSSPRRENNTNLRMSSIGRKDRKLWLETNFPKEEALPDGPKLMKFLYGGILEEVLLFLIGEAGHIVTDQQKEVIINGIKGHMDCKIDGEIVDVKTASDFGFRKFKDGSILRNDSFGYIGQLSGYIEAEGEERGHFLVMNKVTGELTLFTIDDMDTINVDQRITHLKNMLSMKEQPELCYKPVPEGKAGNMRISTDCTYCAYKFDCFPDVRVFKYSNRFVYLDKVVKEPLVEEVFPNG
jgi:hypothetical protein